MNIRNSIITAIRALKKNKLRTALTSIGIIIGVLSVIAMIGVGNSASVAVKDMVRTFGTNAISVFSYDRRFSKEEIDEIQSMVPQIKYITPVVTYDTAFLKYKNHNKLTRCFGVTNDYFKILDWQLETGSFFSRDDIDSVEKVVLIGSTISDLFFRFENPIGKVILIKNVPFRVIGVLEERGIALSGRDQDNPVFVPYTTAEIKLLGEKDAHIINSSVDSEDILDGAEKQLRRYMKMRFDLEESLSFRIVTSKKQLAVYTQISNNLRLLLTLIAAISLIVGGIGIMNIMLVSVSERTREIGIRMAIGAKSRDILMQFLIESVMLSSLGGVTGIVLGLVIYYLITLVADWPFIFSISSILISFFCAAAVGIIFGFFPARQASKMNPIDALRHE